MEKLRSKNGVIMTDTLAGYEIVRQGIFDYGDYMEDSTDADRAQLPPRNLLLHIGLPGVTDYKTIDLSVLPKKAHIKAGIHNFDIPLPFEVLLDDMNAKWKAPILTVQLKVKPPPVKKYTKEDVAKFAGFEVLSEEQIPELPETEVIVQNGQMSVTKKEGENPPKPAQFYMSVDEAVVTVVLYFARAVEDSIKIEGNHISVSNESGQLYEVDINPPFPLKTLPHITITPIQVRLMYTENLNDKPETEEKEPTEEVKRLTDMKSDPTYELQNAFIWELEP
ncbi:hypothetical protein TVAG_478340 [Trichomonas vaginalis G3]|uniref:PIH1D1/2/3 CS-like domain-containing protein n=1 Tax=Trichomonas vaginalis (strain ATCC PRA-98 / G3) TaxID=412133 RepID=A2DZV0_TRIV3|nr:PIH1 CS-like domain family [Trichomonas vaginalis G3]EAY14009.1 hypothetical protein TVAG_478340 [Trichomonas vaginalis G3]KAI5519557.1 PIH1 CS-like domain family [Trichomonas vaginalis G3]|eukprot:XP_001326232.1 hypothetical protein [Trichomonas vaginalis G3]